LAIGENNGSAITCRINDFGPLPVLRPPSVAELGGIVRRVAGDNQAVYALGGQTLLDFGLPPTKPGLAVDVRNLAQVIDYPARDMTITVQAGISIARLQQLLAAENQRLPIDVPKSDRATLGGALATNTNGCRRYGFGTLRDYVIGISAINDEGHEVKAGGRVVKNVAGYDLCKLYVGSLGTLGIITQVTLKVKPRPEEHALAILTCDPEQLERLLDPLHGSRTRPVCFDLLNPGAIRSLNSQAGCHLPEGRWAAVVGFEDNTAAVAWQVQQLIQEIGTQWPVDIRVGRPAEPLWHALVELRTLPEAILTFKANLLSHAVGSFCRQVAAQPEEIRLQAHAGNGIVIGHVVGDLTLARAQEMLKDLTHQAAAAAGNVVLLNCPPAWKLSLPVWGLPRGDAGLMRAVKEKLDPHKIFNPGRFLPGIG
jgi:glycolate oxidase FAD binding subunit